ncbi:hypothetical protein BJV77DRAFT_160629 [Russula vinacea]|nr:hypothetical protein BJV77DRAFT_160629 [Russula vinacea]
MSSKSIDPTLTLLTLIGVAASPTDALDAYASLLPQLRPWRSQHMAAARIASLPSTHPPTQPIGRAFKGARRDTAQLYTAWLTA